MAWYYFKGKNALGQVVQGHYNAESDLSLANKLTLVGISPSDIQALSFFKSKLFAFKHFLRRFIPVRKASLALFYYQLADLLEVNIPIKQALSVLATHLKNPRLIYVIHDIIAHLSRGYSFSDALSRHHRLFSSVTIRLVSFAQSKEELVAILRYCDQNIRRSTFIKRLLLIAMPQFSLMSIFFIILLFLRERYLASFKYALFVFRQSTPFLIRIFDSITSFFTVHLFKTGIFLFLLIFGFKILFSCFKTLRFFYHALLYYFPVISGVVLAAERERLSLLYSVLLKGGASAQKCADCSAAVVNNLFFRNQVKAMSMGVRQGDSFSNALEFFHIFNSAEIQMIILSSISNSLAKTFERIYAISQLILERRLLAFIEFARFILYMFNTALFFFCIFVAETLFYYPGSS